MMEKPSTNTTIPEPPRRHRFLVEVPFGLINNMHVRDVFVKSPEIHRDRMLCIGLQFLNDKSFIDKLNQLKERIEYGSPDNSVKTVKVDYLTPTGAVMLSEVYKNCYLKAVFTGPLSYSDDSIVTVYLGFSYASSRYVLPPD